MIGYFAYYVTINLSKELSIIFYIIVDNDKIPRIIEYQKSFDSFLYSLTVPFNLNSELTTIESYYKQLKTIYEYFLLFNRGFTYINLLPVPTTKSSYSAHDTIIITPKNKYYCLYSILYDQSSVYIYLFRNLKIF